MINMIKIRNMIKPQKTLVMIIGHENPHYLIDTYESIKHYNKSNNYEIVFAIDFNKDTAHSLSNQYGRNRVFVTETKNGWGRGILRTIIHALDYFNQKIDYCDLITIDSDALCVGPFINRMLLEIDSTDVFFAGAIWRSPKKDHGFHYKLRDSGFMRDYPFNFKPEMAAGPCMMWTSHCFKFLKLIGLMPAVEFDKKYPVIHFAHDQLSTWLNSCGVCTIKNVGSIMEIKWRESLPIKNVFPWGPVPAINNNNIGIIHPTKSNKYTEDKCREFFKFQRNGQPFPLPPVVTPVTPVTPAVTPVTPKLPTPVIVSKKELEEQWKDYFRRNNLNFNL